MRESDLVIAAIFERLPVNDDAMYDILHNFTNIDKVWESFEKAGIEFKTEISDWQLKKYTLFEQGISFMKLFVEMQSEIMESEEYCQDNFKAIQAFALSSKALSRSIKLKEMNNFPDPPVTKEYGLRMMDQLISLFASFERFNAIRREKRNEG